MVRWVAVGFERARVQEKAKGEPDRRSIMTRLGRRTLRHPRGPPTLVTGMPACCSEMCVSNRREAFGEAGASDCMRSELEVEDECLKLS